MRLRYSIITHGAFPIHFESDDPVEDPPIYYRDRIQEAEVSKQERKSLEGLRIIVGKCYKTFYVDTQESSDT